MNPSTIRSGQSAATASVHVAGHAALCEGPPPEVLLEMDRAAETHARLRRHGWELRFQHGAPHGVQIELLDRFRGTASAVSLGEAFALACGPRVA